MTATYTPDRGDVIWIRLAEAGQSPVLVISAKSYNQATSLLLACPITSQVKGYPFEVPIAQDFLNGVVLTDQITSLDWTARDPKPILKISPDILATILNQLQLLIS